MYSLLMLYSGLLVLAVVFGIRIARSIKPTHRRTQMAMSFVSGLMLGIAVFHLLPHALYAADSVFDVAHGGLAEHSSLHDDVHENLNGDIDGDIHGDIHGKGIDFVAVWLMLGLMGMFLLQRLFHFHQHDFDEGYCVEHHHDHDLHEQSHSSNAFGVFFGLALHATTDGVALAASILAAYSAHGNTGFMLAGLGVFLAILLHKPLDAITIDTFLRKASLSHGARWFILVIFALMCPLVAWLIIAGFLNGAALSPMYIIAALAFSSGIFLCIALSDLLPEIHFHSHDKLFMTLALLAGILFSLGIKWIEADSSHHLDLAELIYNHDSRLS